MAAAETESQQAGSQQAGSQPAKSQPTESQPVSEAPTEPQLERSLGFWDNLFFAVGTILGAGIYAIIGEAAGLSGSLLWLSLLIAAFTAFLTACVYAELVSMFPDSGGGYEYIAQGLGRRTANFSAIVLFLTGVVSPAAIALAFGQYLGRLWDVDVFVSSTGVIVLMAAVNVLGAKSSSIVNIVATVITVVGLAMVVAFAAPSIGSQSLVEMSDQGVAGIFGAAALAFFSYVGFEDVVKMAEETKKPKLNTPWALIVSGLFVMVVYVAVAIAAVSAVEWKTLADSKGPLGEVMKATWGGVGVTVISCVALFATSKCILSNMMSNSRLLYDLSRDTPLPRWVGYLAPVVKTPVVAIVLIALVTWLFSLIGDLGAVASISNLFVLSLFLTVNISLIVIRRTRDDVKPKFRLPLNIAKVSLINILGVGMLVLMIVFNVYNLTIR